MPAASRSSPAADAAAKSPGTPADGKPNAASASEDLALFGHDTTERIIDVQPLLRGEHAGQAKVRLYRRSSDGQRVTEETDVFYPFFFLSDPGLLDGFPDGRYRQEALSGDGFFRHLVAFRSWGAFWDGVHHVEKRTGTHEGRPDELYLMGSPVRQYLLQSGRTCLKGMAPDDLHRLQLDIETRSTGDFPNPERPEDEIILVALSDNRGWERLLDRRHLPEPVLLEELVQVIREKDPDVIEGHNCFQFDFDYIRKRCDMHGVSFAVGRDGSTPRTYDSSIRFAERMVDFPALKIAGRHIIDTYFRVMAYDVFKRDLPGYGLKDAARYFGFADESRTYVEGDAITALWEDDPERLREYALDDVRETRALAAHLSGSPFYLTQMLPMPYGQAARTGPASKIESLFIREYLRERRAFPRSQWGSQSVGGYTDIFVTGAVGPVVYADVESLYPSIMLADGIQPEGDTLDLFPRLLRRLTDLRFDAKRQMKDADDEDVRGELDARQSSYKVLINCFDPETEIMTVRGAKNVCDVEAGDRVYSLNPHTLEAEVKPVTRVHEQSHYEGEMVRLKNRFVDLLVTPNHRLLTNKVNGYRETGYQWREARDLFETKCRHRLPPRSALTEGHAPATFDPAARGRRHDFDFRTDGNGCIKDPRQQARWIPRRYDMNDWLELMGWFAGEGSLYTSKRYTSKRKDYGYTVRGVTHKVTLNNKTPHHRTAIRSLLVGISSREGGRGITPVVKHGQRRIVDYEGSLHCVTVADNHTVLAGRNGTFNWVGQSFYGSLGFSLSTFNDFEEADKVTRRGQEILRQMIGAIKRRGGDVIESDTDGVFFVPPATYDGQPVRGDGDAEQRFTERLTGALPEGIRVGFDGRYRRMLSYKKKNYALLGYDGDLKFKGSSLVARSSERFGRRFVREAVRLLLEEDLDALHALYMDTRRMVEASDWPDGARSFARTETLKDTLAQYEADVESGRRTRTAPYELARRQVQQEGREVRKGDRISYYITGRGKGVTAFENCKLAGEWDPDAPDENTAYYLDRLDRFTEKFEPFFEEHDFRRLFSPEDLFGFSAEGIELQTQRHEPAGAAFDDEVPF
jgi:DNA polymerase elongation subunit (family B)